MSYHPCGETHEAPTTDDFQRGYIYPTGGDDRYIPYFEDQRVPVIIWTAGGTNIHCTTKLDQNTWEVDRS